MRAGRDRGGRDRVPNAHPPRQPKPRAPYAPAAHQAGAFGGSVVRRNRPPGAARSPEAVGRSGVRKCRDRLQRHSPPGVARSKPTNIARGTSERRRTCGFRKPGRPLIESSRSAPTPRGVEARGSVGPPASRAPSFHGCAPKAGDPGARNQTTRAAELCLFPRLWGGAVGGGREGSAGVRVNASACATPPPHPPPQGGGSSER